jgi:hypothetical protein
MWLLMSGARTIEAMTTAPILSSTEVATGSRADAGMIWSNEARLELLARSKGRRLLLDYFASRCCGRNVSVGDLHLRWTRSDEPIAEEFQVLRAPTGIDAYVQRDLVSVLEATWARIVMRGWGWFRRPVVELSDAGLWLDFIGACRTRSVLRH